MKKENLVKIAAAVRRRQCKDALLKVAQKYTEIEPSGDGDTDAIAAAKAEAERRAMIDADVAAEKAQEEADNKAVMKEYGLGTFRGPYAKPSLEPRPAAEITLPAAPWEAGGADSQPSPQEASNAAASAAKQEQADSKPAAPAPKQRQVSSKAPSGMSQLLSGAKERLSGLGSKLSNGFSRINTPVGRGAMIGGIGGALLLALNEMSKKKERRNYLRTALLGLISGGMLGAAAGHYSPGTFSSRPVQA